MVFSKVKPYAIKRYEHLVITLLTGKNLKNPKESAVLEHILHTGHNPKFDHFETLVKKSNELCSVLESHF